MGMEYLSDELVFWRAERALGTDVNEGTNESHDVANIERKYSEVCSRFCNKVCGESDDLPPTLFALLPLNWSPI